MAGLDGRLSPIATHRWGEAFMLYAQGLLPLLLPLSVQLFEPGLENRRRMLPFTIAGGLTALYILWALATFPLSISVQQNSIVYINSGTQNDVVAALYIVVTCGSLLFSKIRDMVIFGWANVVGILVTVAIKHYAFTSVWCAYAAVASMIILAYFWKSRFVRPFRYATA